jgi:PAS domain S-box-containing protein
MESKNLEDINFETIDINTNDETMDLKKSFKSLVQRLIETNKEVDRKIYEQTRSIQESSQNLEKQRKAMLNLLEDISEERQIAKTNEQELQKFKMAIDGSHEQIVITDSEGIVLYTNPAMEKITGFKINEAMGRKAGILWGNLMDKKWYQKFWHTIKTKKEPFYGEIKNHKKTGEHFIANLSVFPIVKENKKVEFFISILRDITKEKEVDRMKTDFISLASHQLRTPLSGTKWFLEMLKNGDFGKFNKKQLEAFNSIEESNERMISLVNALLNVSRIESGRININPKLINLNEFIKKIINEIQNKFHQKNQKITFKENIRIKKIKIDENLIRAVVLNLLTNANKYTPEKGKIDIEINSNTQDIIINVTDNGLGIPDSDKDKIFQRFFRAQNVTKNEVDGTGLGLYLAKIIMNSSGGKISFTSKEGKGTTFSICIPKKGMVKKKGEISIND